MEGGRGSFGPPFPAIGTSKALLGSIGTFSGAADATTRADRRVRALEELGKAAAICRFGARGADERRPATALGGTAAVVGAVAIN